MLLWLLAPFVVIAIAAWLSTRESKETLDLNGKSVFISGCDTGLGHDLAVRLDSLGLRVFAGCLTETGSKALKAKASPKLQTVICDITKEQDIRNAVSFVEVNSPDGLWALVNNAGIPMAGEWDWLPERYIRLVMEINFFGHVFVTRAFLSLLKKGKGRVVNLSSLAAVIAGPGAGIYACSKYAMEAFNDSLRREMKKWGVTVYVVEPGFVATPLLKAVDATYQKVWNESSDETKEEYGEEYGKNFINTKNFIVDPPELVIDVLQAKVINRNPSLRTRVGKVAPRAYLISSFPTSWADGILSFMNKNKTLPAALLKKSKKD